MILQCDDIVDTNFYTYFCQRDGLEIPISDYHKRLTMSLTKANNPESCRENSQLETSTQEAREEAFMPQTLLEKAPAVHQMNDSWIPRQQEMSASIAKNILIIEDDDGIREILGEILTEETIHQVFLAQDGESGLNILQDATPDLFLVDYRLPDINGLELIDRIRRIKGYEQTPMVLMSASLSRENVTGPHLRYFRKPFDLDKLLEMIDEILG